ncbi:hypothetical protein FIBSPDRAFT_867136, partial [Athelia psychrophila]
MLAQTLLLASLASACWAQCIDNSEFPGTAFPGGCGDFPTLTPFTSTAPFYIAIVGGTCPFLPSFPPILAAPPIILFVSTPSG